MEPIGQLAVVVSAQSGITGDHHGTNSTVPNWECARERDTTQPPALHDYLLGPANKSGAFFTEPVACEPARSGAADLALRRPKGRKDEPLVAAAGHKFLGGRTA